MDAVDFWSDERKFNGLHEYDVLTISQSADGTVVGFEAQEFIGYSSIEIPIEDIWDVIDYLISIARRAEEEKKTL